MSEEKENSSTSGTGKLTLSKIENDLYHEDLDVSLPSIRVKHISLPNKGDRWKIFENDKLSFTVEGHKLSKKEKSFLYSADGINFLIKEYKNGISSFNALKQAIKKKVEK